MDINMKNVKLRKNGNWIEIGTKFDGDTILEGTKNYL